MAQFRPIVQVVCVFLLTFACNARAESDVEDLFVKVSKQLDDFERSFETKLDNVVETINARFEWIENIVGINGKDLNKDEDNMLEKLRKSETLLDDIKHTKHRLMKAILAEKLYMREFEIANEETLSELKEDVQDKLSEINKTVKESNQNLIGKIEQNANDVDDLFRDIVERIENVQHKAVNERGNGQTLIKLRR